MKREAITFDLYLSLLLEAYQVQVIPEFPTGNGQIDLIIRYQQQIYGLEVKSFSGARDYQLSLKQAAHYGKKLDVSEIVLVFFVEAIDDKNRQKYEKIYKDETTGVTVNPLFVVVGA